ncbi:MAG: ketopantoate reductase family protein [Candidatus Velthaea sp.]
MRIAIMGSGGLGGYFGARLARGGEDVIFIARGAHLNAMQTRGLIVRSPGNGDVVLPVVRATGDPAAAGVVDLVFVAVKLWDTTEAARAILPMIGERTTVISFQNGVDKDAAIGAVAGMEHMVGGVGYIGVAIAEPGVIAHTGTMARLVVGEHDGRRSERVETFVAACRNAGIDASVAEHIRRVIWEKFVFLVGLSGSTALMRTTIGPVRSDPGARRILADAMREAVAVARAEGVMLPEDFADERLRFIDGLPPDMDSSLHVDLQRGHRLELPWLAGAVARRDAERGVPTPVNAIIRDALALYAGGAHAA